jgi:tetratricopeptide (TPR) repeat protein
VEVNYESLVRSCAARSLVRGPSAVRGAYFAARRSAPSGARANHRAHVCALACMLLALIAVAPVHVHADDSNLEARTTFERGVEASRSQHWDEARVQFERSLALVPKPSTMFNLALAYIKLGLGREALEQLDAFEGAALPDEHAAMLARAQVLRPQAQALVDSAKAKAQSGGNVLSQSEDGLSDEVRQEVAEARANYQRGRDKQALQGFERAYKKSQRPELLYNIGVVADRLRNDRRAISAYDAFVAALPDAREAAVAQVRSESLRVALEREESAPRPEGQRAEGGRSEPREVNLRGPRVLVATGSILTAASLGTLIGSVVAISSNKSGWDQCLDPEEVCINEDRIRSDKRVALIGAIVSPIVLVTGIVLTSVGAVQLSNRKQEQRAVSLLPVVTQHAGMLLLEGRF